MATRAFTNITTAVAPGGIVPITYNGEDGLIVEYFVCQGGTVGDTTALVPSDYMGSIRAIHGGNMPATDNISTSGSTSVTLTHIASAASTSVNYSVSILGRRQA